MYVVFAQIFRSVLTLPSEVFYRILHRQNSALEFEQNFENCFLNKVSCSKVRFLPYLHAVQLRHCSFEIWLEINEPAGVPVLVRAYGGTVQGVADLAGEDDPLPHPPPHPVLQKHVHTSVPASWTSATTCLQSVVSCLEAVVNCLEAAVSCVEAATSCLEAAVNHKDEAPESKLPPPHFCGLAGKGGDSSGLPRSP